MKRRMKLFNKYQKIFETSKEWVVTKNTQRNLKKNKWCVTEKAHGANFSFVIFKEGNKMEFGKRKGIIEKDDFFFGYKNIVKKYKKKVVEIFEKLKAPYKMILFGELLGGYYPNDDGKIENYENAVQTGIWYCDKLEFYAFDMGIVETKESEFKYLDYEISIRIFKEIGIPFANPLYVGKYEDCLKHKLEFQSLIPKLYGMKEIKDNIAEGIVIKPMKEIIIETRKGTKVRPVLKMKIERFSEKIYDKSVKKVEDVAVYSQNFQLLKYEMFALVTENRINNAISKIGKVDLENTKMLKELLIEFRNDVKEMLIQDNKEEWEKLCDKEKKEMNKMLSKECKILILRYLKKR